MGQDLKNNKCFKPVILRRAVLVVLLLVTLGLLGSVEYACRVLPKVKRKGGGINIGILERRDAPVFEQFTPVVYVRRQVVGEETTTTPGVEAPTVSARPPGEFLQTSTTAEEIGPPSFTPVPSSDEFLQTTPTASVSGTFAPLPDEFLQTTSSSDSEIIVGTQAPSSYLQIDPTGSLDLGPQVTPSPPGAPRPTAFLNSVITSDGVEVAQTILPNAVFSSVATIDGKPVTQEVPAFTTLVTSNGVTYISTIPATATATARATGKSKIDQFLDGEIDPFVNSSGMYFLGAYLPIIIATFFALPWTLLGETTKSLEPFYQMTKNSGSAAERSLAANFHDILAPFWALLRTQWAVFLSSALAWLAFLIIPLAPEAVAVHVIGECNGGCNGQIGVFLPAARAIEGALAAMVMLETILMVYLWKKKTGVAADPRCIAGLATLFSDPDVQRDFLEVYGPVDQQRLDRALQGRTYKLEALPDASGYTRTVAITGVLSGPDYNPSNPEAKHDYVTVSTVPVDQQQPGMRHAHRVSALAFAVFIAGLLSVIITYRYTGGETGFESFMSGQGFGVKFMFTLVAVTISWFWARLFRAIALYAPYRRLFSGNASARESILLSPPLHPLMGIGSSISAGHYLLAFIAAIGLLSEVLCVTLSAIPFNPAKLWAAYDVSTWISVAVLGVMLVALVFIFFYQEPIMPVKPDTMAGNLVYICDGALPEMFKELGGQTTGERDQSITYKGLRYDMGFTLGPGGSRLAVLPMGGDGSVTGLAM